MYCECGAWVEAEKNVSSIKCSGCCNILYNLPKQNPSRELSLNQYYFIIAKNGFVLLTKFKPEANIVSGWEDIIFSGIVDRSKQTISYTIGTNVHKQKISSIPISKPYSKNLAFDFQNLKDSGYVQEISIERNVKKRSQVI